MPAFIPKRLLPITVLLFFCVVTLALWRQQNDHERELVLRHTETAVEQLKARVEGMATARIAALALLADRWIERHPPDFSRERFITFAETLERRYPGFMAINWIDASGVIRWTFPENMSRFNVERNIADYLEPQFRDALARENWAEDYVATRCIDLAGKGPCFEVLTPLIFNEKLQGYVGGAFLVKQMVESALPPGVSNDFCIQIEEDGRRIYTSGGKSCEDPPADRLHTAREAHFAGKVWQMDLQPGRAICPPDDFRNIPLLIFGFAVSVSLSLMLFFLLDRMNKYRNSRDLALYEIGERKRAEDALRENEKQLEEAMGELKERNAEMESFVYTVSHDLKTPIVTIKGFVAVLREDFGSVMADDAKKCLQYVSDAASKMETLISDLLNLSRIGRVKEEKSEAPFSAVVGDALAMLQSRIALRGIAVRIQDGMNDVAMYGERKRLDQVMDNLLSNAVKYIGEDNPDPRIEIGVERRSGRLVYFVRDNGIGIDPKYHEKIFQVFERLPAAKRAGEGTGMGLTIVKRIVECHGGEIWLSSRPGEGSTFFFTLRGKDAP